MKDDYISRQTAIDALGERPMVWTSDDDYSLGERNQYDIDRLAIETVPSADIDLSGFSDRLWKTAYERGKAEAVRRMDDLISREEAYNVLTEYYHHNTDAQHMALHEALSKVPSAEKHARWEYVNYGGFGNWHCSACRGICMIKFEHCPYCGAKMEVTCWKR